MTLKQLPNLALFTFKNPQDGSSKDQVWQKQFRQGTGVAKGLTIDYIAQAVKVGRKWTRGPLGQGGVGGRKRVNLVALRRSELVRR